MSHPRKNYLCRMPILLRNILAVLIGWMAGSIVNMSLIGVGNNLFPIEGFDPGDPEALAKMIEAFEPKHFLFPFLAHAVGTFVGAAVAALIAVKYKYRIAMLIGVFFFLGGLAMAFTLPAPAWFIAVDLTLAYFPMAWLGARMVLRMKGSIT